MKRFIILFSIMLLGLAHLISAQNLKVSLPDTSLTVGANSVSIPMLVQNFNNVGAISLKLNYNSKVLKFTGLSNTPVSGFAANADSVHGVIAIAWFSPDGVTKVNISNGVLLNLGFSYSSGLSPLNFIQAQSDISDLSGNSLAVSYVNGMVSSPMKVSLDNVMTSPGDTVRIPIRSFNLTNIGAISLQINYTSSVLQFIGVQQDSVGFTANNTPGQLKLGWASLNNKPFNQTNGIMAWLVFKYIDNSSSLSFVTVNGSSEIADLSGNILPVSFINGSVSKSLSLSLPNLTSLPNKDVTFALSDTNMSVGSASLKIAYDTTVLVFKSVTATGSGTAAGNAKNGVLTIGFYNVAPTFTTGTLMNLVFTYKTGSSSLVFDKVNSQVTDPNGATFSGFIFNNGSIASITGSLPVFTKVMPDTSIAHNKMYTFTYVAVDPDATFLKYKLVNPPAGALIDSLSGVFTWTPTVSQTGKANIVVTATNDFGSVTDSAVVTVLNQAPVFTKVLPAKDTLVATELFQFTYVATDPDGDTLTYALVKGPAGSTIGTKTGTFSWTPTERQIGSSATITVSVTDGVATVETTTIISVITGILDRNEVPKTYSLSQNYPNPFNPSTNINFDIPKESKVVLKIFNILGEEVATLVNKTMKASSYTYQFNAVKLPSGIYIYRLQAGDYSLTKKMTLLK